MDRRAPTYPSFCVSPATSWRSSTRSRPERLHFTISHLSIAARSGRGTVPRVAGAIMHRISKEALMPFRLLLLLPLLALLPAAAAAGRQPAQPLRVAVAGLVHGHADGLLSHALGRTDVQIVGIAEPDRSLFDRYAAKFHLAPELYHRDLEELLRADRPQAVLAYSSTFDHRRIVELCARYSVAVMMEKPLATTFEDAQAISRAASAGRIPVLVNYETSWYPSNHAAYELVQSGAIGE